LKLPVDHRSGSAEDLEATHLVARFTIEVHLTAAAGRLMIMMLFEI
jgi:hypothetical protein